MGLPRRSHCTPIQPLNLLRGPQPVAVLLARPGPEVVDEVEEVHQGVAAAGELGLTEAAEVSRRAFDL
jgi:2,3-bisphosphoglycerate-independent phosphoglycerate mutase